MKKFSRLTVLLPLLALVAFGAGCGSSNTPQGADGGIWKTVDGGQAWVNKKALVSGPKVTAGVPNFAVLAISLDPQDHRVVYAATRENGLAYSLDGGDSWQQTKVETGKTSLSVGRVNAVLIDPKNTCTVYAASANKIYKTKTCARDWEQVFFDPRTDKSFTKLAIDWYNPTVLFAGTSDGDIFRSSDAGEHWQTVKRVDGVAITDMVMDPHDSRTLYVGTQSEGILKTSDGGMTWVQIKKQFSEQFSDARRVIQVVVDPVDSKVVYLVSKYGILKSLDGGETWNALTLTSPPGSVKINALAIDPKNTKNLVYTGVATLQFSNDGGVTWTPKKLPTTQVGTALVIDPVDPNVMYLGVVPAAK